MKVIHFFSLLLALQLVGISANANPTAFSDLGTPNVATVTASTDSIPAVQEAETVPFLEQRDPFRIGDAKNNYDYVSVSAFILQLLLLFGAVGSMVTFGLPLLVVGIPLGVIATLLAIWGRKRTKKFGMKGRGLATTALILSFLTSFITTLVIVLVLALTTGAEGKKGDEISIQGPIKSAQTGIYP